MISENEIQKRLERLMERFTDWEFKHNQRLTRVLLRVHKNRCEFGMGLLISTHFNKLLRLVEDEEETQKWVRVSLQERGILLEENPGPSNLKWQLE